MSIAKSEDFSYFNDNQKWLGRDLELQLIKAIDSAGNRQSYETFINFYKTLKELE